MILQGLNNELHKIIAGGPQERMCVVLRKLLRSSANKKGIVLTMVLYILIIFVIIGLVLVTLMIANNQASYQLLYSTQAYYLAESGVEYGLYQIKSDPIWLHDSSALSFDGVDDYVELPSVNPTSAITVEAWVKSASSTGYGGCWQLVSKYNAFILGTGTAGGNNMNFIIYTTSWQYGTYFNISDPQNWHHFVGVYDGVNKKLYVDGIERTSDPVTGVINNDTGPIHLAHREGVALGTDHFNGLIDEVRIYNRALNSDEITYSYNYKVPMNREGLVGWWKFNSNYASIDSSGNGNNGSIFGATSTTNGVPVSPQVSLGTGVGFNPPSQSNCTFSVAFNPVNNTAVQNGTLISVGSVPATQVISFDKAPAQRVVSVNVPRVY